jgi:FkbM family methyltransferase
MWRWRHAASRTLLWALCELTHWSLGRPTNAGRYTLRILGGPLRGQLISIPTLIQPAYALGSYAPCIVHAMSAHVSPGQVVYDVGAHVGYLTLVLAKLVGPRGRVFAFEGDPQNRAMLKQNMRRNRARHVTVVPAAVAATSGSVIFATFPWHSFSGHIAAAGTPDDALLVTTPSVSLDDFVYRDGNPAPAFLKIDVEGTEVDVIRGGLHVLQESHPAIIAEVWHGAAGQEVMGTLGQLGYSGRALYGSMKDDGTGGGLADILFLPGEGRR